MSLCLFQVLTNALWYLTNQHDVINAAALRKKNVMGVPPAFDKYVGYNDIKRKKVKELPLSAMQLHSHSQALYSLLLKPVVNSSASWKKAGEDIKQLADCLAAYVNYLNDQSEKSEYNRGLEHPVRTIDEHATIEHRNKSLVDVKAKFRLLDEAVKAQDLLSPLVFDEANHIEKPFDSPVERHRYFAELQLSVPIDIIRFCPGGSVLTTACIVKVVENRSEPEILIEGVRSFQKAKPFLKEFHTREQRKLFKKKWANIANVSPSVTDLIYKELALDATTASHPVTQERLRLIFHGEPGLLTDLRQLNPGRPTGRFDTFFEKLTEIVEQVTAADDRRHKEAHLSEWLSLEELVKQTSEKCPPETPIPSKSLVRLQFAPRNPYTHAAMNFTSRIQVQYKIQRRQLRASHQDSHYCAAQLKYLKEKAVESKGTAALLFCDDKAKVPVGEPNIPVSTGVRGRMSITPCSTTLGALDHDMTKSSLTPSVLLRCDIPESVEKSFVRGQVTTVVNDSIFQMSSPFRHAATVVKILRDSDVKIVMKFTDGGTDQRNTLEAVKCASICVFLELNLDMMIVARCAPGHSWTNPAERIMSILNIGLQNCALERCKGDDALEAELRKCGSMADLRSRAALNPALKEKWQDLIEPVQSTIRNRFNRLSLKGTPFQTLDPVSAGDIDLLQRHLREHFPELDLKKLQKVHTKKVAAYGSWVEEHCRERQYSFQIQKCKDTSCCIPSTLPAAELQWLPDPVLKENDPDHFKTYQEVKGTDTTDNDRPSLRKTSTETKKRVHAETAAGITTPKRQKSGPTDTEMEQEPARHNTEMEQEPASHQTISMESSEPEPHVEIENPIFGKNSMCTAQCARSSVTCIECRKPRVIYSKLKLSERQNVSLALLLSEFDYTCGAPLTPPRHSLHGRVMCRDNLTCIMPIEIPYYGSQVDVGRKDLCCHCGVEDGLLDNDLKTSYKTVLPMCQDCGVKGRKPVVCRPYGKQK
jgi:hypothetical protein